MADPDGPDRNPLSPYFPSDLPSGIGGESDPSIGTYVLLVVMLLVVLAMLVPLLGMVL
jgi:hypothetical protein